MYGQPAPGHDNQPYPGYSAPSPPARPREDVLRGAIFASIVIPLGILAWMIVWNFGFVASVVAWVVAFGAARLYGKGAVNPSRRGVWVVLSITLVTMVLAFLGGMWLDMVKQFGLNPVDAFYDAGLWQDFGANLTDNPSLWREYTGGIVAALAFSALGCFTTMRRMFAATAPS